MADTYTDPKTGKEMPKTKWVDPGFNRDLSSVTKPTAPAAPAKGTQANHAVTDNANHTRLVSDNSKQPIPNSALDKITEAAKVKAKAFLEEQNSKKYNRRNVK